ncbi:hypothetical protein D5S18_26075 [Nocardia panacis]|uniref:Uncharacterized protein n=1 Tax=Nocardia panacis TaxID=2340916 RepID=A0A3A4JWH4_9NOCA|nr:hypothetical protein D5S18_26075 [Nocardia panacis]
MKPSRAVGDWVLVLICVAVVAAGVLVGGLLHKTERSTKPLPPESAPAAPTHSDGAYVTPPVIYPVAIPGCDAVEPPRGGGLTSSLTTFTTSYDNPAYPWFSGAKAEAMTQALRGALPGDVEIGFAPVAESLVFQPIPVEQNGMAFGGRTDARATVLRGDRTGSLSVSVWQSTGPVPPCVAGHLDERRHLADGGIADVQDSWYEIDKVRTRTRSVRAYLPDGTVADVHADDVAADRGHSGAVPLTIDELVAMVTAPSGLRVTTPVPPSTPNPPESCTVATGSGKTIDRETVTRLNTELARIPLDGLQLERPLGDLRPSGTGGELCQAVRANTPQGRAHFAIAMGTGQSADSGPGQGNTRRLPNGVIVGDQEVMAIDSAPQSRPETARTVTVTYASGSWVRISCSGETAPMSYVQLEAIALTPGLEVVGA